MRYLCHGFHFADEEKEASSVEGVATGVAECDAPGTSDEYFGENEPSASHQHQPVSSDDEDHIPLADLFGRHTHTHTAQGLIFYHMVFRHAKHFQ